jgi:ribosomal RNA-processing protein 1
MPTLRDEEAIDLDLKAMELAEFEKKLALGDGESDSDYDVDLENRKKGKLKRKISNDTGKLKQKKPKLSKLHNSRFFNDKIGENSWEIEDFSKDTQESNEDDKEEEEQLVVKEKPKKSKKSVEEPVKKLKLKKDKRKSLPADMKFTEEKSSRPIEEDEESQKPKKSLKMTEKASPSTSKAPASSSSSSKKEGKAKQGPFTIKDEWSEPLKDGEVELFLPSRKIKLKEANKELELTKSPGNLLRNPFAAASGSGSVKKSSSVKKEPSTPQSAGKRVVIALNRNKAQHPHEYIKQVKDSPNLPYDSTKKPTKSLLKPNVLPSPINPFYQKKIGLKLNMNDTL